MTNDKFKRDFAKIIRSVGEKSVTVVRMSVIRLGSSMVQKSPVDTGRFKGNWQYGSISMNTTTNRSADKSGSLAISRIIAGLQSWKPGQTIYITNSLPYAKRLEYGWSQQAPAGMVRLSVMEFKNYIAVEAAKVRYA